MFIAPTQGYTFERELDERSAIDYILLDNATNRSLIRTQILDTQYVRSDHHIVEATLSRDQTDEDALPPAETTKIPYYKLKDSKVRIAFETKLNEIWKDLQHFHFENTEEHYEWYNRSMTEAMRTIGETDVGPKPENRKLKKLRLAHRAAHWQYKVLR